MGLISIGELYFPDTENHFQIFAEEITAYQQPQREKAFEYVTDWRRAVDLGANVGIFSRHFAQKFEEVLAIEPDTANVECLRLNVPENVIIRRVAIGETLREVALCHVGENVGGSFVYDHAAVVHPPVFDDIDAPKLETVQMVTLDSFELDHLGLLKLDIQGSEVIALLGGEQTLKRCRPVVLIEEKPLGGPGGAVDHIEIARDLLIKFGMTPKEKAGADRVYVFE